MKIAIDIDDMAYKFVQNTSFVEDESTMFEQTSADRKKTLFLFGILDAIKNGTPLPEGAEILTKEAYSDLCTRAADVPDTNVGDLISRQAAFIALNKRAENVSLKTRIGLLDAVRVIGELPSVEPERKPGHWEWDQRTGEYVCSECGCNPIYERTTPDVSEIDKYRYCRWCGAPMEVDG